MVDYDARVFRSVANSDGGDVNEETTFHYHQRDNVVWATYAGGSVVFGTLLAKPDEFGNLDMRYQHVSVDGSFKSGRCQSRPERLPDGRLRLHERWQWTDGADGQGVSIVEEVGGRQTSYPPIEK
jgi:hypothetical protein